MFKTIIVFLLIFSVIVIIHEFGHYYFAKRAGILVREFALGMGPKLFQKKYGETVFTVRLLPIGGYVRMAGAGEDDIDVKPGMTVFVSMNHDEVIEKIDFRTQVQDFHLVPIQVQEVDLSEKMQVIGYLAQEQEIRTFQVSKTATIVEADGTELLVAPVERQFQSASLINRMLTNFAGPLNNFILAIVTFIMIAFLRGGVSSTSTTLGTVLPDSPAATAGLVAGDTITSVAGNHVENFADIQRWVANEEGSIEFDVTTADGVTKKITITPQLVDGNKRIGITPALDTSLFGKIKYGFTATYQTITAVISGLGRMITGGFSLNELGGPVAMYSITNQVVQDGFVQVLVLFGMISANLGVMNLLPIPGLDGGKLLLNIVEAIRRKPLDPDKEAYITMAGAALLLVLMIAVTWNDIMRLFG